MTKQIFVFEDIINNMKPVIIIGGVVVVIVVLLVLLFVVILPKFKGGDEDSGDNWVMQGKWTNGKTITGSLKGYTLKSAKAFAMSKGYTAFIFTPASGNAYFGHYGSTAITGDGDLSAVTQQVYKLIPEGYYYE
jgi:hypothetical protein